jgi:PAS domain S-box-containing protein
MTDRTPTGDSTRPVLDRIADAFFAVDDRWRFTYLNRPAAGLFDRKREELVGRVIWDEFPETVETQFPHGFYQAMNTQDPVTFEVYHTPLETWFEVRAFPSEDGISVYLQDVTDEKRRRKELARYEAIVENAHDGVLVVDAQNRIQYTNAAVEEALGVSGERVRGRHVDVVSELLSIRNEDLADIGHALDNLRSGRGELRQFDVSYVGESGRDKVAEIRMMPLDDGTANVAGIVRDITERYENERVVTSLHDFSRQLFGAQNRLEIASMAVHATSQILELEITGAWLLDDEMGYLDPIAGSSGAYEQLGGLPRFNEGEGLIWNAFRADEATVHDDLSTADGLYNPNTDLESEMIVPMGSHGVLMSGALEPNAFDETDLDLVSTLAATAEAALDRADRERLLRERKAVLERQTERLEAVSAVIERNVRDRLDDAVDALASESVATRKLVQADGLLDDVLQFLHGRASIGPRESVRLDRIVERIGRKHPSVAVDPPDPATLRADPDRIGKLFEGLFEAAAARAEDRTPVTVALLGDGTRGFEVIDRGPELPGDPDRVFEVGFDAGGDAAGLGLPIAREVAEAHDWSIRCENDDNDENDVGGTEGVRVVVEGITTLEFDES